MTDVKNVMGIMMGEDKVLQDHRVRTLTAQGQKNIPER